MRKVKGQIGLFEQLSAYGEPLKVRPADSLLNTMGCLKTDCFSCGKTGCRIRQEERYCRYAPMGNSYSCETMKKDLPFRENCQFVNQALAYHRAASPCCVECNEKCGFACERSRIQKIVGFHHQKARP